MLLDLWQHLVVDQMGFGFALHQSGASLFFDGEAAAVAMQNHLQRARSWIDFKLGR